MDKSPAAPPSDATLTAAPPGDASPAPEPALPPRYHDLGRIASGGCGDVRRVLDTQFDRALAIKVLRWEYVDSPAMRARFLVEAEVTAQLEHPGIVAVHERGELLDGRLWFTMKEVRGRTLSAVIDEVHAASGPEGFRPAATGWTFRRLVDAFARIAQAVAFAHRRGVVHRDLKPDNLMAGEYGEVLVMDWGLARRTGAPPEAPATPAPAPREGEVERLTRVGEVLGTPAYMPPEQARGQHDRHGPESDVYALGAILYHLLTGRPPYGGTALGVLRQVLGGAPLPVVEAAKQGPPVPAELVSICERAMMREIGARYPDAGVMAEEVVAWLDGARRREQALVAASRAQAKGPQIAAMRARKAELEGEARSLLEEVKPFEAVERKAPAWAREDEAARLGQEAALLETEWLEGMHGALSVEPELAEAHSALAEHYKDRLLEAERGARGEDAIRFEALLRAHDRGAYGALLRGEGALTLVTDPPGASVTLYRYVEEQRRLSPVLVGEIGPTPIREKAILKGSYVGVIRAAGRAEVRYPVLIERGGHWDGVPPGETEAFAVPLPREGEIGAEEVYVPAGWCWVGGDPLAQESLPERRIWIDGFMIHRFPVTNEEYLAFLDDLVASGQDEQAFAACPRAPRGVLQTASDPVFERAASGRFALNDAGSKGGSQLDWPVALVDWSGARAFSRWIAARTGAAFRLPDELEREKAARGVDGRVFPWGRHFDATWACVIDSHAGASARASVARFPLDESPYGARGLGGNGRDWCENVWEHDGPEVRAGRLIRAPAAPGDPGLRAVRGGAWSSTPQLSRSAGRFASRPEQRWTTTGVRLSRSYPVGPGLAD